MFKKNKFLKYTSGAALMASAPALVSLAGEGENYSANENQRNNIYDEGGLTCSTVVTFTLLGITVIGLIIYACAVANRKVELKKLDEQVVDRRDTICKTREELNEARIRVGELSEKVQSEKEERDKNEAIDLQGFKENKKKELLVAQNKKKLIIDKLNYLLGNGGGYLSKVSHLVDLCEYLVLINRETVSEQEKGDLSKLEERIKNYDYVKRDGRYTWISEESAEELLERVIGDFKNDDLRNIDFIEKHLKINNILMENDTFDAETFLVKGERNRDYSTLLNEFTQSLKDFDWEIKNWRWLEAQATTFMEYLQKEKKHLQGMKEALKGGGIDDNDKELLEAINKYQEENKDEKKEKTKNEKELEEVQRKVVKLREELKKLGVENENMDNKDFGLEEKRNNLGKNLYKPWILSENYD